MGGCLPIYQEGVDVTQSPLRVHWWCAVVRLRPDCRNLVNPTLRARSSNDTNSFNASVFAIELVRPAVRERLHMAALKLRSDTRWLQECRYGLMCHWTSQSFPRRGERKPYDQAVREFDVEGFAGHIGPPRWNVQQLAALLNEFIARKNVPIFNLEIYQEGALSPKSVQLFRQVAAVLTPRR